MHGMQGNSCQVQLDAELQRLGKVAQIVTNLMMTPPHNTARTKEDKERTWKALFIHEYEADFQKSRGGSASGVNGANEAKSDLFAGLSNPLKGPSSFDLLDNPSPIGTYSVVNSEDSTMASGDNQFFGV